jgi:hypothetical protein
MVTEINLENYYQVGGSLAKNSPIYVERTADHKLYENLKKGEFCYVFNSRQMGKSSLRLRVKHLLEKEGCKCASLDLTMIGGENLTLKQWYLGLAFELWHSFRLGDKFKFKAWWQNLGNLSPVQKLSRFIEEILLKSIKGKIFIFVDEIDTVNNLDFSTDDFFRLIRFCYNQRGDDFTYSRLNWALFGVTAPSDLIKDKIRTPFNIGKAIELKGFNLEEVSPLAKGLEGKVENPQAILKEILAWTGGQPFLTQKLCQIVANNSQNLANNKSVNLSPSFNSQSSFLSQLVTDVLTNHSDLKIKISTLIKSHIIDNWQLNDNPEHLKTISDRLTKQDNSYCLLKLYQQILETGDIANNNSPEINQLLLSGIVIKQQNKIKINNPIYAAIFNQDWLKSELEKVLSSGSNLKKKNLGKLFIELMQEMDIDDLKTLGNVIATQYPEKAQILAHYLKQDSEK